jgi:hypothetical protein
MTFTPKSNVYEKLRVMAKWRDHSSWQQSGQLPLMDLSVLDEDQDVLRVLIQMINKFFKIWWGM